MSEKTEKPSQHKLRKARERGEVSKSVDLPTTVMLVMMLSLLYYYTPKLITLIAQSMHWHLASSARIRVAIDPLHGLLYHHTNALLPLWAPFAGLLILTACFIHIAQTGFIFNPGLLSPKWERLHPKKGFKQLFSTKQGFMLIKVLFKFTLCLLIASLWFNKLIHHAPLLLTPNTPFTPLLLTLFTPILALFLLMAFIDKRYSQWRFHKDQQMSRQEVQEEHKMHEGSPKVKAKIRQNRMQFLQKLTRLHQVRGADFIITNPTHYAIALRYDEHTMPAPKLLFKGQGFLALAAKKLARQHAIRIIENPPLARALYRTGKENQWINPEFYSEVAALYRLYLGGNDVKD